MKKYILLYISIILSLNLFSQEEVNYKKREKGFIHHLETNFGISTARGLSTKLMGATYTLGYLFTENLSIGLGVGYQNDLEKKVFGNRNFIPLFIESRYFFFNGKPTPFIYFGSGYAFGVGSVNRMCGGSIAAYECKLKTLGGVFVNPALGFNLPGDKLSFNLIAGYKFQQLGIDLSRDNFHMFDLKFGVTF
jgi:hypothetical protein